MGSAFADTKPVTRVLQTAFLMQPEVTSSSHQQLLVISGCILRGREAMYHRAWHSPQMTPCSISTLSIKLNYLIIQYLWPSGVLEQIPRAHDNADNDNNTDTAIET